MVVKPLQAVADPDALFERVGTDPSLRWPVAFVVLGGVLASLPGMLVQQALRSAMPAGAGVGAGMGQALLTLLSLVTSVVRPLVAWLVLAAAFHAISARFGGKGGFLDTLKLVGWGFLPALVLAALAAAVAFVAVNAAPAPSSPQEMQSFLGAVQANGYVTVAGYLPVAFTVWQGFVWTFAVRTARDLSLRAAARTVAGPVALLVAWTAYVEIVGVPGFVLGIPFVGLFLGGGGPI